MGRPKLTVHKDPHKRKPYTRKDGTKVKGAKVKGSTFKIKDRGKPGRTPKSQQFYHPKVHMGWKKTQSATERRRLALKAHKGDKLATARALLALSNVTTDALTKERAGADAMYFFNLHNKSKKKAKR